MPVLGPKETNTERHLHGAQTHKQTIIIVKEGREAHGSTAAYLEVTEAAGWWWSWSCVFEVCCSGLDGEVGSQCSQEDSE